jgi:hypothetical protein
VYDSSSEQLTLSIRRKVKVKCTLVQALRLCTGRTADRGSRGIALLFHDHGTRREWEVSVTPRPLFTSGKDPVPIVQEAGWALGSVRTGAEKLAHTGIQSPDRPARPVAKQIELPGPRCLMTVWIYKRRSTLTFRRRNYFLNFSTLCI